MKKDEPWHKIMGNCSNSSMKQIEECNFKYSPKVELRNVDVNNFNVSCTTELVICIDFQQQWRSRIKSEIKC